MSKYNNLKKLYSDIEILESAGLYKAANILHKKFVREAQVNVYAPDQGGKIIGPDGMEVPIDTKYDDGTPFFDDGELNLLVTNGVLNKDGKKYTFTYKDEQFENDPNRTIGFSAESTGVDDSDSYDTPTPNNSFNQVFTGLGNAMNSGQAKKNQPILNDKEEIAVYKRTVDQIASILSRKNVPAAQKLAKDYQNYFSNPQRNVAFQDQVNRIFARFNQQSPFGPSVASQPEMSNEEGQQLTNLVNQNVKKQNTTQPNATKPNVVTSTDTNNQLYQIVSNFYRSRDVAVTSPEQMYADLKADPARKNVVRNHIRTSKNPNTNQLVALFDSKTK
jgi:hypothetical protein